MTSRIVFLSIAMLMAGCGAPGPATTVDQAAVVDQTTAPQPERRLMTVLDPVLGCGTLTGTGDSHPNDGKFYELTVKAEKNGTLSKGTVALYVMNDVLFGPNPVPDPVVYQGTVTSLSVSNHRAVAKGVLSTGKPFTLRVDDQITDAISDGPVYDYFWFSTEGLEVDNAYIHEGDLIVKSQNCK